MNKLESLIRKTLNEAAKINFGGHSFILKLDTNEDPNKKGIKVQFLPTEFGTISKTEHNDIANELALRLDRGLAEYELRVERDRELKDKTVIGFFIYVDQLDKIIRKALSGQTPDAKVDEPTPDL